MTFDIHALDGLDYDEVEEGAAEEYQDTLLELFLNSPEGQERAKQDPEIGFWARVFMDYGRNYTGDTLPQMNVGTAIELVEEIFPRKISVSSPDDADDTIPELIAFWEYLKREYQLPNANAILDYLREIEPDFRGILNDPSRYGMAKSFFMLGQEMGFDMTDEEDMNRFIQVYNAAMVSGEIEPPPLPFGIGPVGSPSRPSRSSRTRKAKGTRKKRRARAPRRRRKKRKRK